MQNGRKILRYAWRIVEICTILWSRIETDWKYFVRLYVDEENLFDIVLLFVKKYDRKDNFEKYIYLVICSLDHIFYWQKKAQANIDKEKKMQWKYLRILARIWVLLRRKNIAGVQEIFFVLVWRINHEATELSYMLQG